MLEADHPIVQGSEDRLGRRTFAKSLARCILDYDQTKSLTIGLYGGPGVGKTSILNLALEELHYASNHMVDADKPIILNFNAWLYAQHTHLASSFLQELLNQMLHAEFFTAPADKKILHLLKIYLNFFLEQDRDLSLKQKKSGYLSWWKKNKIENTKENETRDFAAIKAKLNQFLSLQTRKFIVFIDNISPLSVKEIMCLFQIVKAIGNFSNTVYVLALDKTRINHALKKMYHHHFAHAFLEKIVQLPFAVPTILKEDLDTLFLDQLKNLIPLMPYDSWNKTYWADLYYTCIKYFFTNMRDVTRYINILNFSYAHVREVVNPVDFFAITALQIFEPEVYHGIRDNKDLFVDLFDTVYVYDNVKLTEDKLRCDEILNRAQKIPREMLELLLIRLFPRLRNILKDYPKVNFSEKLSRKYKHISTYDLFETYFRLSIANTQITDAEFETILAITGDAEGFQLALLRLNQDNKILKLLELLDSRGVHRIAKENIAYVVNALIDSADLFPPGDSDLLRFDTSTRVYRILQQLLMHFADEKERCQIMLKAMQKAVNSLYIMVHVLNLLTYKNTADDAIHTTHADFLTPASLEQLKKIVVERIVYWRSIDRLIEHPQLMPILLAWVKWGEEKDCKQYLTHAVQTDRGLLTFLRAALHKPIQDMLRKEEENKTQWRVHLKNIENFIVPEKLIPHASKLFKSDDFMNLQEEDQLALLIFLSLVQPDTVREFGDRV